MCITYINEENIGDEPVIILASKDGNPINIRSDPNLVSKKYFLSINFFYKILLY